MIDFIFSNKSQREPAREDLHINERQSGRVTDDMAVGRDKDRYCGGDVAVATWNP